MDRIWYIYALIDPRTNDVRYVGTTVRPNDRLRCHIKDCERETTHKAHWICQLLALDLRPIMQILDQGAGHQFSVEAEQRWIAHYRTAGARLTNHSDGGDGPNGHKWTDEQRAKIIGRPVTPDARKKISAARTGQPMNARHRERLIAVHTGKPLSDEHKAKISAYHKTRVHTPDEVARMAASLRGRKNGPPSEETRRKLSVSKIGQPQLCGICKSPDHNRRTCPERDNGHT